jgi:predicted HicB family RNase H-like nuclease
MTTRLPPSGKVLIKVPDCPVELHREVKARAVRQGLKIGDYIIKVLEQHVKNRDH